MFVCRRALYSMVNTGTGYHFIRISQSTAGERGREKKKSVVARRPLPLCQYLVLCKTSVAMSPECAVVTMVSKYRRRRVVENASTMQRRSTKTVSTCSVGLLARKLLSVAHMTERHTSVQRPAGHFACPTPTIDNIINAIGMRDRWLQRGQQRQNARLLVSGRHGGFNLKICLSHLFLDLANHRNRKRSVKWLSASGDFCPSSFD